MAHSSPKAVTAIEHINYHKERNLQNFIIVNSIYSYVKPAKIIKTLDFFTVIKYYLYSIVTDVSFSNLSSKFRYYHYSE